MRRAQQSQPRGERTRARILEAAARHFGDAGYDRATLEDIAESVGIRGAALFYHFHNKRELYREVLTETFVELFRRLEWDLGRPRPLPQRLEQAISTWVGFLGERPEVARILLREGAHLSPDVRDDVVRLAAPLLRLLEDIFEEGRRDGHFGAAPVDPLHFVSAIAGTAVFFVAAIPSLLPEASFDPHEPGRLDTHRLEMLTIARRLLGLRSPRPVKGPRSRQERKGKER